MPKGWSKGYTKHTHPSVRKISETMKLNKIDNFAAWRKNMKESGKMRSTYPELVENGDLAELIGVILGDGHIRSYPRTEELSIFSNSNNLGFVRRYSRLVEEIFNKRPAVTRHGNENCTRIRIYQKYISSRLGIPFSPRLKLDIPIPEWVLKDKENIVRYLRGLYEAEGCFSIHKATYTYKAVFTNHNVSMLRNVYRLVKDLGFHPHIDAVRVQISRKNEVIAFRKLIQFRKY